MKKTVSILSVFLMLALLFSSCAASLDKVLTDSQSVGLVSIGHIHPDTNYCSFLNGTYYHVVRPSGYNVTKNPGCVKITIHTGAENTREMYAFEEIIF